mgnify:CR=1 FL=1
MSKLTIKTLAKELGLSIATVSKALKDSHEISTETKKKVLAIKLEDVYFYFYTPTIFIETLKIIQAKVLNSLLHRMSKHTALSQFLKTSMAIFGI